MRPTPPTPEIALSHVAVALIPIGEIAPNPVTSTRLFIDLLHLFQNATVYDWVLDILDFFHDGTATPHNIRTCGGPGAVIA